MVLISLLIVWFCFILTIESSAFAWNARTQVLIAIGDFSMLWIFASIPFGAIAMLMVSSQQTLEHLQNSLHPGSAKIDPFQEKYGAILRDIG
jgi:TRAP-type C4-dicarboxylate transport system permease small subunit